MEKDSKIAITDTKLLDAIIKSARDAIVVLDNIGNVIFWNPAAEKLLGYSSSEVIGKNLHKMMAPKKYQDASEKGMKSFKDTGRGGAINKTLELEAIAKNGKEFPIELSLSSIQIKGRWLAIGIIRDVSDRKKIENELKDRAEASERMNKLMVGRELKMVELKNEIKKIKGEKPDDVLGNDSQEGTNSEVSNKSAKDKTETHEKIL